MTPWMIFLAAEVAEAAEPSGGLFDLDATLPLMAAQILLLMAILNAVFFKPLTKAIDERNEYIRTNQAEARERLEKAKQLAAKYEQELADTRRAAQAAVADAQAEAQKIRTQQLADAQAEAQAQVAAARSEIDQQKAAALAALEGQVDALSRQILEKLLGSASGTYFR